MRRALALAVVAMAVAAPAASAQGPDYTLRATGSKTGLGRVSANGSFKLAGDPNLAGATAVFGTQSSLKKTATLCRPGWRALGLRISFVNLGGGDSCELGSVQTVSAFGKAWRTERGLKIGSTTGYPRAVMDVVAHAAAAQGLCPGLHGLRRGHAEGTTGPVSGAEGADRHGGVPGRGGRQDCRWRDLSGAGNRPASLRSQRPGRVTFASLRSTISRPILPVTSRPSGVSRNRDKSGSPIVFDPAAPPAAITPVKTKGIVHFAANIADPPV